MGERCLSALTSLGGEATTSEVLARVEADWQRTLLPSQVSGALTRLSREHSPKVTWCPDPGNAKGKLWRLTGTLAPSPWLVPPTAVTDMEAAEALARELPLFGAAVASAVREAQ
jgi:hypothetical protein